MKHFNCIMEAIPHHVHRYSTLGDWYFSRCGALSIKSTELSNWKIEFITQLHELIEAALCYDRSISEFEVDKFDISHLELDDPGASKKSPYHKEHMFAEKILKIVAKELDINLKEYEAEVDRLFEAKL